MISKQHVIDGVRRALNEKPVPHRRVFLRSCGFEVEANVPGIVSGVIKSYDSTWGKGLSKNTDIRFKQAHAEARDVGIKAVMRFRSDG